MGRLQVSALTLIETAQALVADDKGLLAMDESTPTCNKSLPPGYSADRRGRARIAS